MPQRNLDILRNLLLRAESIPLNEKAYFDPWYVDLQGQLSDEEVYHLILMRDAGLIEGKGVDTGYFRITNLGHDYIDSIRSATVWSRTKEKLAEVGGSASLEVVKSVAIRVIADLLKLGA